MSNKLKRFITENRSEFDDQIPPPSAWREVERSIQGRKPEKQIPVKRLYRWSATAAVFFIVAVSLYFLLAKGKTGNDLAKESRSTPGEQVINGEIGRMEPGFAAEAKRIYQTIETQQKALKAITQDQPELYSQFSEDLATLDSSYRVLKTKALNTPNREVIIRAMLQNLQLQAELLSKQLQILNEFKTDKTLKNEKTDLPRT
ncbi:MAG TPA: hypothetical protein PK951_04540 [Chitinophagaceae bacterium]|nr:hypothetical protein [Chitinophagaceae bacterium]HUM65752.1 hypothetical protein [Chitinophagaceae bacterium]